MPVVLKALIGEKYRDLAKIEEGVEVVLGRSLDADISLADDPKISGIHLRIRPEVDGVLIFDLKSTNGTFIGQDQISEGKVAIGEMFRCGGTQFVFTDSVSQATNQRATLSDLPALGILATAQIGFWDLSADEVLDRFALKESFEDPPNPGEAPGEYALRLAATKVPNASVTFTAYALEKRTAVWWLTRCIRQAEALLDQRDEEILKAAEAWVLEPSDANRRQAMKLAESLEMSTPACWACVGAFWSQGSMAPPEAPPVEVKDHLCGKAISGGAIMASVFHHPEKALDKQIAFTQLGVNIAAGQLPWE